MTYLKERIIELAKNKGISVEEFATSIGMTYSSFKGNAKYTPLNSDAIVNLLTIYNDVNVEWLIMGDGEMLKKEIVAYKKENKTLPNIPLVSQSVAAGFGSSNFSIGKNDVKDYYVIPKFKDRKIDFMIEVSGSSMLPKYNSGDVIACTIIRESGFIQWNKVHVIATREQGLLVKRIKDGGNDSIMAISDNKEYPPFSIPKEDITGIAIVVGVIRLE